jgi:hypothetical protein
MLSCRCGTVRDGGRLIDRLTSNEMERLTEEELQAAMVVGS